MHLPFEGLSSSRILVVDDNALLRGALRRILERAGLAVLAATSGEEALALLAQHPVRMVISDLQMPGMNGLQLLAEVATRWPQITRLILTGQFDQPLIEAIQTGKVHRCLAKPWDNQTLVALVSGLLAGPKDARALY